jgi:16S rRNA U1498 N3-methylase RsmE
VPVTLGKRILRTETAPLAALSVIMYASGNMEP